MAIAAYDKIYKKYFLTPNMVLGGPPRFAPRSDPNNRVFKMVNTPAPIINIYPGRPKSQDMANAEGDFRNELMTLESEIAEGRWSQEELQTKYDEIIKKNIGKDVKDARWFVFDYAHQEYLASFTAMYNYAQTRMGGNTNMENKFISRGLGLELNTLGGLYFFADKSTSINESNSNSFEDSVFSNLVKTATSIMSEINFLGDANGAKAQAEMNSASQNIIANSLNPGLAEKVTKVMNGNQLLFPKKWMNSEFNRSYSLVFKFESAYGDSASVWRDVITPFLALVNMAFPIQSGSQSYGQPYLVRVDAPGWFSIDTGVITDMQIRRGGEDEDWTIDGLIRKIEVTIDVVDLYPSLMVSPTRSSMEASNFGLISYLDSLAGVDIYRAGSTNMSISESLIEQYNRAINSVDSIMNSMEANIRRVAIDTTNKLM